MDRRLTPATDRVALASLRGIVDVPTYVTGETARVAVPLADLCRAPFGPRDRQVLLGETVTIIDRLSGWVFVQASKDGYCGYLPDSAIGPVQEATHWVTAPSTQLYPEPRVQARETAGLPFGAMLTVIGQTERFAQTPDGFVPFAHIRPLAERMPHPVAVAALFLGAPYLWGGNSRAGIDCSGLVQAALLACGIPCPGDSDLQAQSVGAEISPGAPSQVGDLVFWKGHVAMVADATRLIHATGHVMAVVFEDIDAAIARIAATGQLVLTRRRP